MFSAERSRLGPQEQLLPLPSSWVSPLLTLVPALCPSSGCPAQSAAQGNCWAPCGLQAWERPPGQEMGLICTVLERENVLA